MKNKRLLLSGSLVLSMILSGSAAYAQNDKVQNPSLSLNPDTGSFSKDISTDSFSSLDPGSFSLDMSNFSLDTSKLSTGNSGLNSGTENGTSLNSGVSGNGNLSLQGAASQSETEMKLKAETPSLDEINMNLDSLDLESMANFKQPEAFEMKSFEDMQSELTESMKLNATDTLTSLMGDSFKGLDTNLFGTSGMPDVDFTALNVEYASLMADLEKQGFGKEFSSGKTFPDMPSTSETMFNLDEKLATMDADTGSIDFESIKKDMDEKAVDPTKSVKDPTAGKKLTAGDANSLFKSSFSDLPKGVTKHDIPNGFGDESALLTQTQKIRSEAIQNLTGSDAYTEYTQKLGLAQTDKAKGPQIGNDQMGALDQVVSSANGDAKKTYNNLKTELQNGN